MSERLRILSVSPFPYKRMVQLRSVVSILSYDATADGLEWFFRGVLGLLGRGAPEEHARPAS